MEARSLSPFRARSSESVLAVQGGRIQPQAKQIWLEKEAFRAHGPAGLGKLLSVTA